MQSAQWMPLIATGDYRMPAQGSATEFPRLRLRSSATVQGSGHPTIVGMPEPTAGGAPHHG
jgi:hypothetical protein